ncbi:hypothetical protein RND71_020102 [Anisodus tanguticus]|uniref:Retrovirus-related Pol polyprotein from transposon TNT 1-94-like beta-barrel domain-containing protein n=1 Tax=Anisodus tanguticus TaxID=243964 RepID=A0AAE1VI25_9SOLA|nr:hypothetical protein RND71_020102 [Anisodus tanguticus]
MDTGATSHLTRSSGNLSQLLRLKCPQFITVDNGHHIPIEGYGNTHTKYPHPPFSLNHVLYTPNIIKNLISARKFTRNNFMSVKFNHFGFSVKELNTEKILTRCNSVGDLYPFTQSSVVRPQAPLSLVAISPSTWPNILGHP